MRVRISGPHIESYECDIHYDRVDAPVSGTERAEEWKKLAVEAGLEDGAFSETDVPNLRFEFLPEK